MAAIHGHLAKDGPRVSFAVAIIVATGKGGVAAHLQSTVAGESRCKSTKTNGGGSHIQEAVLAEPLACCKKVAYGSEDMRLGMEEERADRGRLGD